MWIYTFWNNTLAHNIVLNIRYLTGALLRLYWPSKRSVCLWMYFWIKKCITIKKQQQQISPLSLSHTLSLSSGQPSPSLFLPSIFVLSFSVFCFISHFLPDYPCVYSLLLSRPLSLSRSLFFSFLCVCGDSHTHIYLSISHKHAHADTHTYVCVYVESLGDKKEQWLLLSS